RPVVRWVLGAAGCHLRSASRCEAYGTRTDDSGQSVPARDRWRFVPMARWIRHHERRWLRGYLIAGIAGAAPDRCEEPRLRRDRGDPRREGARRHKEAAVQTRDQLALGRTVVLRRQPVRIVEGRAEDGYADALELI